jgi:hypothetical protein
MVDSTASDELIAELVAIEVWDERFKPSASSNEIEKIAYAARQVRRQEIRRCILQCLCRLRPHFTYPSSRLDS